MAKANSTRRKAGASPSKKPRPYVLVQRDADAALEQFRATNAELYHHPQSAKEREPQDRQERLSQLRAAAAKAAKELPAADNPLLDDTSARGTVANVRTVLAFLEASEFIDHNPNAEAEEGYGHICKWLVGTLEYADAQMERESEINRAVIAGLQGGEKP